MTKRDAFEVLRYFDRLDEDELIALSYSEIDRYAHAIEVAFDGVCGRPPRPDEPEQPSEQVPQRPRSPRGPMSHSGSPECPQHDHQHTRERDRKIVDPNGHEHRD